jgi:hypothetical protein
VDAGGGGRGGFGGDVRGVGAGGDEAERLVVLSVVWRPLLGVKLVNAYHGDWWC